MKKVYHKIPHFRRQEERKDIILNYKLYAVSFIDEMA
jgi:hypothetical protein